MEKIQVSEQESESEQEMPTWLGRYVDRWVAEQSPPPVATDVSDSESLPDPSPWLIETIVISDGDEPIYVSSSSESAAETPPQKPKAVCRVAPVPRPPPESESSTSEEESGHSSGGWVDALLGPDEPPSSDSDW